MMPEFRSLLLDRHRAGTAAQSIERSVAGRAGRPRPAVRRRLDGARRDRPGASERWRRTPYDQGLQLTDSGERMLSGLLALAGIAGENMVRDPGWYMLDSGRGLERALQVLGLLRATLIQQRTPETDRLVVEAVLTATESIVTFRRRYRSRTGRRPYWSCWSSTHRTRARSPTSCTGSRTTSGRCPTPRPRHARSRLLDSLLEHVRITRLAALIETTDGRRDALDAYLGGCWTSCAVSEAVRDQFQQQPPTQQPIFGRVQAARP